MGRAFGPSVAVVVLVTALPVRAGNWGDNRDPGTMGPDDARSKAICRGLKGLPPLPLAPGRAGATPGRHLSAEALYYGMGVPPNPARARDEALRERSGTGDDAAFSGDVMLMTIYANGVGAPRDLDRAIAIACTLDGAPAEEDGRVNHLAALKAAHWTGHDFSFCDDVTSGYAQGLCAAHDATLANARRGQRLAALTAGWTEADRRAFQPLRRAEAGYAEAHAGNEVDLSGTARAAMAINQRQEQETAFLDRLQALEKGAAPAFTAAQADAADARLNAAYQLIRRTADTAAWGTVTKDGIRTAQRAWLRHRDAWIAFARVRYPAVAPDSLRAALTEKRNTVLEAFLH